MPNKKTANPHSYQMDTRSVPQRNRMKKLLDNAMVQQQLVSYANNLKQKQILHKRSAYDRIRGELAQRSGNLAGQTVERLESRKAKLERLASKLLRTYCI